MLGVSPSFFFSKYTTDFSIFDYIDGLDDLIYLGIDSFQGEIFNRNRILEWEKNANKLSRAYKSKNLEMSLFVAHFFIHYTDNYDSIFNDECFEDIKRVCEIVVHNFREVETIVIPIGKYQTSDNDGEYNLLYNQFVYNITYISNLVKSYGLNLALEIIPGSIIGGIDGLIRIIEKSGCDNLGYNFDTGHAYCSGEILSLIPEKLKGKIFGTHLKDNFGNENLALPLGLGDIDFKSIFTALEKSGYKGSYDLELSSDKENLIRDYSIGVNYLKCI